MQRWYTVNFESRLNGYENLAIEVKGMNEDDAISQAKRALKGIWEVTAIKEGKNGLRIQ